MQKILVPEYVYLAKRIQENNYKEHVSDDDVKYLENSYYKTERQYSKEAKSNLSRLKYLKRAGYCYMHGIRDKLAGRYEKYLCNEGDKGYDWKYLPTPELASDSAIFLNAGAGINISFEIEMANRYPNATSFILDPSPQSVKHFEDAILPVNLQYVPKGLGQEDGSLRFFRPELPGAGSLSTLQLNPGEKYFELPVTRVCTFLAENSLDEKSLVYLKFDIEGAEHGVVNDLLESNLLPQQIALEFDQPVPPWTVEESIKKLLCAGYDLISVWELNCLFAKRDCVPIIK